MSNQTDLVALSQGNATGLTPLAGSVVQTVYEEIDTGITINTSSFTTVVYTDITPRYADSKILIKISGPLYKANTYGDVNAAGFYTITRDGTPIPDHSWATDSNTSHYAIYTTGTDKNIQMILPFAVTVQDAPSSTSSVRYRFRLRCGAAGYDYYCYQGFNILLQEIAQ